MGGKSIIVLCRTHFGTYLMAALMNPLRKESFKRQRPSNLLPLEHESDFACLHSSCSPPGFTGKSTWNDEHASLLGILLPNGHDLCFVFNVVQPANSLVAFTSRLLTLSSDNI